MRRFGLIIVLLIVSCGVPNVTPAPTNSPVLATASPVQSAATVAPTLTSVTRPIVPTQTPRVSVLYPVTKIQQVITSTVLPTLDSWQSFVFFFDESTGWLCQHADLYITHDGGATWQLSVFDTPLNRAIFISPFDGFAETILQRWKTTDGGATWQVTDESMPVRIITETNKFNIPAESNPCHTMFIQSVSILDDTTGWILCGSELVMRKQYTLLLRTDDGGATWYGVSQTWRSNTKSPTDTLTISGSTAKIHFVDKFNGFGTGSRLSRTTDGGLTWQKWWNEGLPEGDDHTCVNALWVSSPTDILIDVGVKACRTQHSFYRTHDGGLTWQHLSDIFDNSYPIMWTFTDSSHGYGFAEWTAPDPIKVYTTINAGASRDELNSFLACPSDENDIILSSHMLDQQEGFLLVGCGMYHRQSYSKIILVTTHDGWQTSSIVHTFINKDQPQAMSWWTENDGCLINQTDDLLITNDGGITWQFQTKSAGNINQIVCRSSRDIWAMRDQRFLAHSTNSGVSWQIILDVPIQSFDLVAGRIWVTTEEVEPSVPVFNRLLFSDDDGQTWTHIVLDYSKLCPDVDRMYHVYFIDKTYGWLMYKSNGFLRCWFHTTDGGKTWYRIN